MISATVRQDLKLHQLMPPKSHQPRQPLNFVSRQDYDQWRRESIWDMMRGMNYGESFCNRFQVVDFHLMFLKSTEDADRYIQNVYLRGRRTPKN